MVCMGCIVAVFAQTVADGKILLQIWKSIKSIEGKLFSLGLNSSQQPKSWPKDHIHCLIQHNHPPIENVLKGQGIVGGKYLANGLHISSHRSSNLKERFGS